MRLVLVAPMLLVLLLAALEPPVRADDTEPKGAAPVAAAPLAVADRNPACEPALNRAQSLLRDGHHVDAHLVAQTMSLLCEQSTNAWTIIDAVALTHLEEHERAYRLLESVALKLGPEAARARILASWVMVKGNLGHPAVDPRLAEEQSARIAVFDRIHHGSSPGRMAQQLSGAVRYEVTAGYARLQAIDTKRPWLAGVLSSLVPGLGQAYSGSWQGAGISLLLNGLFVSATVELAREELYFASATTGVAASIFYVGNILNAVDLAKRYNEGATSKQRQQLEYILVPEARF